MSSGLGLVLVFGLILGLWFGYFLVFGGGLGWYFSWFSRVFWVILGGLVSWLWVKKESPNRGGRVVGRFWSSLPFTCKGFLGIQYF